RRTRVHWGHRRERSRDPRGGSACRRMGRVRARRGCERGWWAADHARRRSFRLGHPDRRGADDRARDARCPWRAAAPAHVLNQRSPTMEAVAKNAETRATHELGDESFMSAADLRAYMAELEMANALKEVDAMDRAEKARKELIKTLSTPADLTEIKDVVASVQH